jgi:molybdopterin/thiamine biosynthesis adenylyltransferase
VTPSWPTRPTGLPQSERRAAARVLVVGVGGLGCPAALALADGGVGHLTLVDDDVVAESNLHRQVLYVTADAGRPKVEVAAEVLGRRGARARLDITPRVGRITADNALALVRGFDVVLDGTDQPATKFLLSDACVRAGVPLVHAGAVRWVGQLLVMRPGDPCLRCLFEDIPPAEGLSCAEQGVAGPVVGVLGALQAERALGILDQDPSVRGGELVVYDGLAGTLRAVRFGHDPECRGCGAKAKPLLEEASSCPPLPARVTHHETTAAGDARPEVPGGQ